MKHKSHSHCWEQDEPACGLNVEHKVCCLCGEIPLAYEGLTMLKSLPIESADWEQNMRDFRFIGDPLNPYNPDVERVIAFVKIIVAAAEERGHKSAADAMNEKLPQIVREARASREAEIVALIKEMAERYGFPAFLGDLLAPLTDRSK